MTVIYFSKAADGSFMLGPPGYPGNETRLQNREQLIKRFSLHAKKLITPAISPEDKNIIHVDKKGQYGPVKNRPRGEAIISTTPDIAIGFCGRDCAITLLEDTKGFAVAAIHASRHNLKDDFLERALDQATFHMDGEMRAHIGPCLQQPSHIVSADVAQDFVRWRPSARDDFTPVPEKPYLFRFNYAAHIRRRLERFGAEIGHVSPHDTFTDGNYFSKRATPDCPDQNMQIGMAALRV